MIKLTIPPGFGLIPRLVSRPAVSAAEGSSRDRVILAIEFRKSTPLEYLERWVCANEVFEDDVRISSVVRWRDESVSFCIRQPQYDGDPVSEREIFEYFHGAGWTHLKKDREHLIFFNYAFQVMAIDALPRNCYQNAGAIQPFDVILCRPTEELEVFLQIYS